MEENEISCVFIVAVSYIGGNYVRCEVKALFKKFAREGKKAEKMEQQKIYFIHGGKNFLRVYTRKK